MPRNGALDVACPVISHMGNSTPARLCVAFSGADLVIGLAVAAVLAGAAGVVAGIGSPAAPRRVSHPRPGPSAPAISRPALPGPIPRSVATTVLMWPVVAHGEYPTFGPHYGPPAYLDNLATRRLWRRHKPAFGAGDFQPYLVQAGRWLVYVGGRTCGCRNLCHQAIFMNHAAGAVAPLNPDLIEVGDAIG